MDTKLRIGLKIWQIADSKGFKKQGFAKEMDISRQTLDNWISGETSPDVDDIIQASRILGVSPGDFIGYKEDAKDTGPPPIPFYDTVVSAGYGLEVNEDPVTGPTDLIHPGSWFKGADAAMRVTGDSMFPKYRAGSIVALRQIHDKFDEIMWGEDYVVEMQENRVLRTVHQSEKGVEYIDMLCLNPGTDTKGRSKFPVKTYSLEKVRRIFKVIGKFDYETGAGGVFIIKEKEAENISI